MRKTRDSVVLLLSRDLLVSAALVRTSALEKDPQWLDQVRTEAASKYNQSVLVCSAHRLPIKSLMKWVDSKNEPDVSFVPWEEAALWAVSNAVDTAQWLPEERKVILTKDVDGPLGPVTEEHRSLDKVIRELEEWGREAWDDVVPVDGGGKVFDFNVDVRKLLFAAAFEHLRSMEWA